jgi:iron complex transport system permease protein
MWALSILAVVLVVAAVLSTWIGYRPLDMDELRNVEAARIVFFQLRLPRVLLAGIVGASLGSVGAALQAMFRNPLGEPFTLGVAGGGTLGASVAIALGWGYPILGVPPVFIAGFVGSGLAVCVVYRIAHSGSIVFPGTILLAGVAVNLTASAGVIVLQYLADYTRALKMLRWTIGSLDIVGFELIGSMLLLLIPGWFVLLWSLPDLHLMAMGEEVAASLGVNVSSREKWVFVAASLIVGVTVAVGGTIAFVGLIVPHTVRMLFGEDVRIVVPCSFLLGASFLMGADTLARTLLGESELPVGAVTALSGGLMFLWLLRKRQKYSAF